MLQLANKTVEMLTKLNTENGPVFKSQEDLETVAIGEGVEAGKSQFGHFLNIQIGETKRLVNVRNLDVKAEAPKSFKLQVWKAIRSFKPNTPNAREIKEGDLRVFAIPA